MLSLPKELLQHIMEFIDDTHTLHSFTTMSKLIFTAFRDLKPIQDTDIISKAISTLPALAAEIISRRWLSSSAYFRICYWCSPSQFKGCDNCECIYSPRPHIDIAVIHRLCKYGKYNIIRAIHNTGINMNGYEYFADSLAGHTICNTRLRRLVSHFIKFHPQMECKIKLAIEYGKYNILLDLASRINDTSIAIIALYNGANTFNCLSRFMLRNNRIVINEIIKKYSGRIRYFKILCLSRRYDEARYYKPSGHTFINIMNEISGSFPDISEDMKYL